MNSAMLVLVSVTVIKSVELVGAVHLDGIYILKGIKMKLKFSKYNHLFETDGCIYLYNILSTALVELDAQNAEWVRDNDCMKIGQEELNDFIRMGFVVPESSSEHKAYQYFYDGIRYGRSATAFHITFIPTYSCNLACPYCLQGGAKKATVIDDTGVAKILAFVRNKVITRKKEIVPTKLVVSLYGGEPMMAKEALWHFCDGVKKIIDDAHIPAEFDMASNMTLLDDEMVSLIKQYKIHVQASIDGSRHMHDKRRIKLDGSGTYDIIVKNLQRLIDEGMRDQITIRLNVDSASAEGADETFAEMMKYSDDVYFAFLTPYKGVNDNYQDRCVTPDCYSAFTVGRFNKIISKYGRKIAQPFGKKAPCAINCENKYWIDCNLDVYKCELVVKMPECRVGTLSEDGDLIPGPGLYAQMTFSPFENEKCKQCKMLPLCAGGCPATEYINSGIRDGRIADYHQCTFTEESLTEYLVDYVQRKGKGYN